MTGAEMVFSFQELLETVSPKFKGEQKIPTYEILDYLNRTVERYIKVKYLSGDSFKSNIFKLGQSPDDLSKLIINDLATPGSLDEYPGIPYSAVINTPADFLFYIRSSTLLTRTKPVRIAHASPSVVPNVEIDFNDIDNIMTTAYNSPILVSPMVTVINDSSHQVGAITDDAYVVITDKYCTLTSVYLDYVKKPEKINMVDQNCELGDHLHEEIVKLSVSLYLDEYKLKLTGTQQTR